MSELHRYRRRRSTRVVAVRLDLDTPGFEYVKWGHRQRCKSGDWLVNNGDDTYTVDAETFQRTYAQVAPGVFEKVGDVWAERARHAGSIESKEGRTSYAAGDWLVYNDDQRRDGYAITPERFDELYERAG